MKKIIIFGVAALTVFFAAAKNARADLTHYNNIVTGERATGLAGAYTGVSDDPSGLYYNPAGVAFAYERSISVNMMSFQSLRKEYEGVFGTDDWVRESTDLFPSYFGMIESIGPVRVGLSLTVLDDANEFQKTRKDFNGVSADTFTMNYLNQERVYNAGPSAAYALNDKLSIGATLYFHLRNYKVISDQITVDEDVSPYDVGIYSAVEDIRETGINPVLGVMWMPTPTFSVGASASHTMLMTSSYSKWEMVVNEYDNIKIIQQVEHNEKREMPYNLRTGFGWFPTPRLLLSADLSWYSEVNDDVFGDREETLNAAVGLEYYLNRRWAIRTGLFTDNANTPDVVEGKVNQQENVDITGVTFSLTRFSGRNSISLGMVYGWGEGEVQVFPDNAEIQNLTVERLRVFFGSSVSY